MSGLPDAAVGSFYDAAALHRALGDRLGEAENLRLVSYLLWLLGRTSEGVEAGRASLRLLEGVGPCRELAWSLVNMAELASGDFDPRRAEYASRAMAVGIEIGETAVVVRARAAVAMVDVTFGDTGWDEVEGIWREAMTTEGLTELGGVIGAMLCWFAALHHHPSAPRTTSPKPPASAPHAISVCFSRLPPVRLRSARCTAESGHAPTRMPTTCSLDRHPARCNGSCR